MDINADILVTGAAGFIGSCLVGYLNRRGFENIIIADEFRKESKKQNYAGKKICARVERDVLFDWLNDGRKPPDFIFHLGARTDTTEFDYSVLEKLNVSFSQKIWNYCMEKRVPLVYASSAATYGDGTLGYKDNHDLTAELDPLNPYGKSKNEFDKWALGQKEKPPFWAGLKFFNVYGPNEYHKGRMASVIFQAYNQILSAGKARLFRSHNPAFKNGEQLRDFIYVMDVVNICYWMMNEQPASGLYNVGTGKARTFNDLAKAIFNSLGKTPVIEYIDTPEDIRDKYQYFTEADITKLRQAGYRDQFISLEEGVGSYVSEFLLRKKYY